MEITPAHLTHNNLSSWPLLLFTASQFHIAQQAKVLSKIIMFIWTNAEWPNHGKAQKARFSLWQFMPSRRAVYTTESHWGLD